MKEEVSIRVGCAGWAYDDWRGIVYPDGMAEHPLQWMSRSFDTVEINSSFYRPPSSRNTAKWCQLVDSNPSFRFTLKLWRGFTHDRGQWPSQTETRAFVEAVQPLFDAGRLGAVLAQFPWSFRRNPENRRRLARILDVFPTWPWAIELRHASWNRPEVQQQFSQRGLAFCAIDQPVFRDSIEPADTVTGRRAYIRLHGRNKQNWFRQDAGRNDRYDYLYSEDEIRSWLVRIERMRNNADEIFIITNNHYRGQAVVNAFEFQHGLGRRDYKLPAHLIEHYPRLKHLQE